MNITIDLRSALAASSLVHLADSLGSAEMSQAIGVEVQRLTADHLREIAATRHTTAQALGASPTNHWAGAAEKVESPAALSAEPGAATLTVRHPGIRRAMGDVTIVPRTAKSLAIPVHAIAYGRRPGELWDSLQLFIPKGKDYIAMTHGNEITVLYMLRRSVTQRQDRSLLPSEEQISAAAAAGAQTFVRGALTAQPSTLN